MQVTQLVIAGLVAAATIGFFAYWIVGKSRWVRVRRMKRPVDGQLLITSASVPDGGAQSQNCRITGVLTGPGIEPTAVSDHFMCPTSKWTFAGQTVPVTFDAARPSLFAIDFDKVSTGDQVARKHAEELAARMRGDDPG